MGDPLPVVLIHAPDALGGAWEWGDLAALLQRDGRLVRGVELPGFGPAGGRPAAASEMVSAVAGAVAEAGPCHVVARGMAAGYVAVAAPAAMRSLAVIAPRGLDALTASERREPSRPRLWLAARRPVVAARMRQDVVYPGHRLAPGHIAAVARHVRRRGMAAVLAALGAGDLDVDARQAWCEVAVPVLLLWGEAGDAPPLDDADRWLMPLRPGAPFFMHDGRPVGNQKPGVTYRTILGARQMPHLEQPEAVQLALLAHFRAVEAVDTSGDQAP